MGERRWACAWAICCIGALAPACAPPLCPPVPATLPGADGLLPWIGSANARSQVSVGGAARNAVLDTGAARSAIAVTAASGLDLASAAVDIGGASTGPLPWDALVLPPPGIDVIVGADVLVQLPLVFDARARHTRVLAAFQPVGAASGLAVWSSGLCRADQATSGPEGPQLLLIGANLDGRRATLAVDTGAAMTLVRSTAIPALASRPTLSGLMLSTGFAGTFAATATRLHGLAIGADASANAPVLFSDEIDAELDGLLRRFRGVAGPIDGYLGWSFLREFEVSLALGDDALTGRALGLTRFNTQAHYSRDFVGIGISTSPSSNPAGLRIASLFSVSPARDAGLEVGDVILTIGGAPAASLQPPYGSVGAMLQLGVQRGTQTFSASVAVADLLPDPP